MSASCRRYQPGDPLGLEHSRVAEWPENFVATCEALGFPIHTDPALRMRLWALWKDARSWE